ncbi:unnamed protein product [Gongylonema pulchrum]|uniref:DAG1 domain-containing protein n=1 Tax=Gongylonema pulchrum TaxID=637853 RepID=A0A183E2N5_9BILA|nr:unnamed protein product [Gongylonema pulchrum]
MRIYAWIIVALVAITLISSVLLVCLILILKLAKNRVRDSGRSITVRPKMASPIDAYGMILIRFFVNRKSIISRPEYDTPYDRIASPSVIVMPEYPVQNSSNSIREPERYRSSSTKSNGKPERQRYTFSSRSKRRSEHFVDRDPPSDESRCDYLDPLDLDLGRLHQIYISNNNNNNNNNNSVVSKETKRPPISYLMSTT